MKNKRYLESLLHKEKVKRDKPVNVDLLIKKNSKSREIETNLITSSHYLV